MTPPRVPSDDPPKYKVTTRAITYEGPGGGQKRSVRGDVVTLSAKEAKEFLKAGLIEEA